MFMLERAKPVARFFYGFGTGLIQRTGQRALRKYRIYGRIRSVN